MSSFLESDKFRNHSPRPKAEVAPAAEKENSIPVDGFGQVVSLLQVADPAFRESLIGRIAAKDPVLARQIRAALNRNS